MRCSFATSEQDVDVCMRPEASDCLLTLTVVVACEEVEHAVCCSGEARRAERRWDGARGGWLGPLEGRRTEAVEVGTCRPRMAGGQSDRRWPQTHFTSTSGMQALDG